MNDILSAVLVYLLCIIISIVGLLLVRRSVALSTLESHNEVAGFVYAVIGVIYGVLLAFVVLVVWEQYNTATDRAEMEAATLTSLQRDSKCFPETMQKEISNNLKEYCASMINEEYPAMENNVFSENTSKIYTKLWNTIYKFDPQTDKEKIWYEKTIEKINQLGIDRRMRIMSVDFGVPPFMWVIIILGGIVTVGYSFLFCTQKFMSQAVIVFFLTTTIVLSLTLVAALDQPFGGIIKVSDEPFKQALHTFEAHPD